ncbi:MAG: peptide chain release factor 2 [Elusimicrobia bacterium]|nr:peptide chain release factor 2 [Elusimicrobiota bacterium]
MSSKLSTARLPTWGGFFDVPGKKAVVSRLEQTSTAPGFWEDTINARKVMRELDAAKNTVATWNRLSQSLSDLSTHLELAEEAKDEAEEKVVGDELSKLQKEIVDLEIQALLGGPHDASPAILTVHAGAGGTEAADWAEMLLRMYLRWAERKGLEAEIADILAGDGAGIRKATVLVRGAFAYGLLKAEMGVHRLVRISPFDANARRHTSFASVDVIPEIEDDIEIVINPADLKVDTYRASGAGGQHVNKTESAIRITHIPTGVIVACQKERSQIKNRETAMKMLKSRLYDLEQEKQRAALEKHYDERGQIAWGHQIRSYVFMPYQMVKDLRTDHETSNIQGVMDGDLDPFIKAYLDWKTTRKDATLPGQ